VPVLPATTRADLNITTSSFVVAYVDDNPGFQTWSVSVNLSDNTTVFNTASKPFSETSVNVDTNNITSGTLYYVEIQTAAGNFTSSHIWRNTTWTSKLFSYLLNEKIK